MRIKKMTSGKITAILASTILVVLSFVRVPVSADDYREFLVALVKMGCVAVTILVIWSRFSKFAAALLVLGAFSIKFPQYTKFSDEAFARLFIGVIWYVSFLIIFKNHGNWINYSLCVSAIIHLIAISVYPPQMQLMTNPNEQSGFFAICFPSFLLLPKWLKLFSIASIAGVTISGSFNGIVAISIVCLIYGIYLTPQIWYLYCYFFGVVLFLYSAQFAEVSVSHRLSWWGKSIEIIKQNWLYGCGIGNWKLLAGKLVSAGKILDGCYRLHNTWLQGTIELGINFVNLIVAYSGYTIFRMFFVKVNIVHILSVIAFLVVSNTNSWFQINAVGGVMAIAILARLEIAIRKGVYENTCIV